MLHSLRLPPRLPLRWVEQILIASGMNTMVLLDLVMSLRRHTHLKTVCDQIANASVEAVCRRVEQRVGQLGPAEARGYIRAHSAVVVRQKTDVVLAQRSQKMDARRDELIALSREEIIHRVLKRVRSSQTHSAPMRRAA